MSPDVLFPLMFTGVVALAIGVNVLVARSRRRAWGSFALEVGLNFDPGGFFSNMEISGTRQGHRVRLESITQGSGKNSQRYTSLRVSVGTRLPRGLVLKREGLGERVLKMMGTRDIQVGDQRLDDALLVQGWNSADVAGFLRQPAVRAGMLRFIERWPEGRIEEHDVLILTRGVVTSGLGQMLADALAIARVLKTAGEAAQTLPRSSAPQLAPGVAAASTLSPEPDPVDLPVPELPVSDVVVSPSQRLGLDPFGAPLAPPPAARVEPADGGRSQPQGGAAPSEARQGGEAEALSHAQLVALVDGLKAASSAGRAELLASTKDRVYDGQLQVDTVKWTMGLGLAPDLADGRTVVGRFDGVGAEVSLRMPKAQNAALDLLRRGVLLPVRARVTGWDDLYRRLTLEDAT